MKKSILTALILICAGLTPVVAFSQATVSEIMSCNKSGVTTASAGSTEPLRGPYVPVADYTVELNTGLLVLKECVLRVLATSQRKAGMAVVIERTITKFNTGNGGEGFPSRELGREEVKVYYQTVVRNLDNQNLSGLSDTIESKVKNSIARGFFNMRDPRNNFVCEYANNGGNLSAVHNGTPIGSYWDGYDAVSSDPGCSVLWATDTSFEAIAQQSQYEVYKNYMRYLAGQGVYDVAHYDEYGFRITDTPGSQVNQIALASVLSPFEQAQQADDIGEMLSGMYLGVTNQVLSEGSGGSVGGLAAITQALGGAASYMGQVVQRTGGEYTDSAGSAVIGAIERALAIERQYNKAVADTATLFTATNGHLRAKEAQCYTDIVTAVCEPDSVSGSTCTARSGGTLTITKATGFSQKVITSSILPLTSVTIAAINNSNTIITRLEALIAGLRITNTALAQTTALASLTAIAPHTSAARDAATGNLSVLGTQMATLLTTTSSTWSENGGWCEVANQEVKDKWNACWGGDSSACPQP